MYEVLLYCFLRFSLTISVLRLVALTVYRLLSIRNPFRYTVVQMKHIVITIVAIWVLSIGFVTGCYYASMHILSQHVSQRFGFTIFPITIIPAVIVFSICYVHIFKAIHLQRRQFQNRIHPVTSDLRKRSFEMSIIQREAKVARFMGCAAFTFVLCWIPLAILGIVIASGATTSLAVENALFTLALCNSATNPLIHFRFKSGLIRTGST